MFLGRIIGTVSLQPCKLDFRSLAVATPTIHTTQTFCIWQKNPPKYDQQVRCNCPNGNSVSVNLSLFLARTRSGHRNSKLHFSNTNHIPNVAVPSLWRLSNICKLPEISFKDKISSTHHTVWTNTTATILTWRWGDFHDLRNYQLEEEPRWRASLKNITLRDELGCNNATSRDLGNSCLCVTTKNRNEFSRNTFKQEVSPADCTVDWIELWVSAYLIWPFSNHRAGSFLPTEPGSLMFGRCGWGTIRIWPKRGNRSNCTVNRSFGVSTSWKTKTFEFSVSSPSRCTSNALTTCEKPNRMQSYGWSW